MPPKPSPEKIIELGLGFTGSKVLLTAIGLGVFTALAKGPLDGEALRRRLKLHKRSSRDFFDALVALGMLDRKGSLYRNTPSTGLFLDRENPAYIGGFLEMCNARLYSFWGTLDEGLKTGLPQNEVKHGGPGFFETLYSDPRRLSGFLRAMTGLSRGAALAIAGKFPWKNYKTVIDVGGAQGDLLVQVVLAHPHLTGANFDLPVVGPIFKKYAAANGLAKRLSFAPGDFFADKLPKADVIVMGHILHDWDLKTKRMLIKKAHRALPKGGAFIVFETMIDDERRRNAFGLIMSLNMLIETPGGFDYTAKDCQGWLKDARFSSTRAVALTPTDSMVIGIK